MGVLALRAPDFAPSGRNDSLYRNPATRAGTARSASQSTWLVLTFSRTFREIG